VALPLLFRCCCCARPAASSLFRPLNSLLLVACHCHGRVYDGGLCGRVGGPCAGAPFTGRGTTVPFQMFGAPGYDAQALASTCSCVDNNRCHRSGGGAIVWGVAAWNNSGAAGMLMLGSMSPRRSCSRRPACAL
jgi:hypothetical protein